MTLKHHKKCYWLHISIDAAITIIHIISSSFKKLLLPWWSIKTIQVFYKMIFILPTNLLWVVMPWVIKCINCTRKIALSFVNELRYINAMLLIEKCIVKWLTPQVYSDKKHSFRHAKWPISWCFGVRLTKKKNSIWKCVHALMQISINNFLMAWYKPLHLEFLKMVMQSG